MTRQTGTTGGASPESQLGFLAYTYVLLARSEQVLFLGTPEGRVVGVRTKFAPDVKLEWFLEPIRVHLSEYRGVLMVDSDTAAGADVETGKALTFTHWQDEETGIEARCCFSKGRWYVLETA